MQLGNAFCVCRQAQLWALFRNGMGMVGGEEGCTALSCNLWCDIWNGKNRLSAVHFVNLDHRHKFSLSWEGVLERISSTVPSLNSSPLSQRPAYDQWDVAHGLGIGKFAFGGRLTGVCVCYSLLHFVGTDNYRYEKSYIDYKMFYCIHILWRKKMYEEFFYADFPKIFSTFSCISLSSII